jgi:bifunctional UDP-N-acetylglucosamine pyrophosphorylase/glucosamine-1-phosphate N-acetyltransferase
MKSALPKVLHTVLGRPMLHRVLDVVMDVGVEMPVVVTGHGGDAVVSSLSGVACRAVTQEKQLGTAHAVRCAEPFLADFRGDVLIVCGDTPLIQRSTLRAFFESHVRHDRALSILSTILDNPVGYGRILRSASGRVTGIVEEKDASEEERQVREINTGIYLVDAGMLFRLLERVKADNAQGEYYLTDIVRLACQDGRRVGAEPVAGPDESLGVNSRRELARAEDIMLSRVRNSLMDNGVTFHMPETVYVEPEVTMGEDVIIHPNVMVTGRSIIGAGVEIGPFSFIDNCQVEPGTVVPAMSLLR